VDAPTSHGEVVAVAGEMREIDAADLKQPAGLLADRIEHDGRLRAPRYQRGKTPQRRLFIREPVQLFPRLGIRDCGRKELRELAEPALGFGRQPD
jgi:hypothetical protein